MPFIEEDRLMAEVLKVEDILSKEEQQWNSLLHDLLFVSSNHHLAPSIFSFYDKYACLMVKEYHSFVYKNVDPWASGSMNGCMYLCKGKACPFMFTSTIDGMPNITNNQVLSIIFK